MPFTSNSPAMEHFCAGLSELHQPSPLQTRLHQVLALICQQSVHFDHCISKDSPFFGEFFHSLQSCTVDEDHCFSILECLIIFCREKALRGRENELSSTEQALLEYFENSGQWEDPQRQTLISQWYWTVLPERHCPNLRDSAHIYSPASQV